MAWQLFRRRKESGAIALDKSLSRGQFRQLTEEEIDALVSAAPETAGP